MKVVVGMSGGVDSAVAAWQLQQQGHEVIAVFMKNWQDADSQNCTAEADFADVRKICEKLDIPYYTYNFSQEYWDYVFAEFLAAFKHGYTPNPDILCNKEIKFRFFLEKAIQLGADKIATGHYARVEEQDGLFRLLKGRDPEKDQSYFLCLLDQKQLARVIFPIGELNKADVRKMASDAGLHIHDKKDSTGICFIGERKFNEFLSQYLPAQPGSIVDLEGNVLGEHQGTMYYTIGQRKGIGIGGPGDPLFVVDKDLKRNLVVVARGEHNSALYHDMLVTANFHLIAGGDLNPGWSGTGKIRYRQEDQAVKLIKVAAGRYYFQFTEPQRAITPGQELVLYEGDNCLGGGLIIERFNQE